MRDIIRKGLNVSGGGYSKTIRAQYYKNNYQNFFDEGAMGATAVIELWEIKTE